MKKFIIVLLTGFVIVAALDFAVGSVLRYFYFTGDSGINYRTSFSMQETKADVLIFGTSRAYHHYAAELIEDSLGMSSYNTGRDGEYIFYQTAVLKAVLERYVPKLIVLDFAGSFNFAQEDYDRLSVLLPYYKDHPEIRDILELRSKFEKYKLASRIYPYNSGVFTIASGNMAFNKNRTSNKDYHGYVPLHGLLTKELHSVKIPKVDKLDGNKVHVFKAFLEQATAKDIQIVVVNSPYYYLYEQDESIDIAKAICAEFNVPFYDFSNNAEFLAHADYFEDETHLNKMGAEIFTNKVIQLLKEDVRFSGYLQGESKE